MGNSLQKWTMVTSHAGSHGLGFMEMVLKYLHKNPISHNELFCLSEKFDDQYDLLRYPGDFPDCLNKLIILVQVVNKKDTRKKYENPRNRWDFLKESIEIEHGSKSKEVISRFDNLLPEEKSIDTNLIKKAEEQGWTDGQMHDFWQIIHEMPIEQQIKWFSKYSHYANDVQVIDGLENFRRKSEKKIKIVKILMDSDEDAYSEEVKDWFSKLEEFIALLSPETKLGINVRYTKDYDHLAWRHLKSRRINLKQGILFELFTKSMTKDPRRFRSLCLRKTIQDVFSSGSVPTVPGEEWWCESRKTAKKRLEFYRNWGDLFSIVIFGSRGCGKSKMIQNVFNLREEGGGFEEFNCAAIPEQLAESLLFGHEKNAFTGADTDEPGAFGRLKVFQDAKSNQYGVLFLDEFHHLPKSIQPKLLTALQTNQKGEYSFRKIGGKKPEQVKFQLILGTNWTVDELLHGKNGQDSPVFRDLLDRVLQRRVTIPELNRAEFIGALTSVWNELKFIGELENPLEPKSNEWAQEFQDWLQMQNFPGNFRELQRLAILMADTMRERTKVSLDGEVFEQIKIEWNSGLSEVSENAGNPENPEAFFLKEDDYSDLKRAEKRAQKFIITMAKKKFGKNESVASNGKLSISTVNRWAKSE